MTEDVKEDGGEGAAKPAKDEKPATKRLDAVYDRVKGAFFSRVAGIVGFLLLIGVIFMIEPYIRRLWSHAPTGQDAKASPGVVLAVFPNPQTSSPSRPMLEGLGLENSERVDLAGGFVLERLYEIPDDPPKTAARIRERLKAGDVVLVLGHERSTMVEYLNKTVYEHPEWGVESPIPLILPAATNPDLTAASGTRRHILRLPTTDDKQVNTLAAVIEKLKPNSVGLIHDLSNPTYSEYIGKQLVAHIDNVDQSVGVSLSADGMPGSILERDVVIVAAMENLAKVLLRFAQSKSPRTRLIFTDGVAGPVFEGAVKSTLKGEAAVWMSGPFPTKVPKGGPLPRFPDYAPYAALAKGTAVRLLQETKSQFGTVTRQNVLKMLWQWLGDGQNREVGTMSVTFDSRGDNALSETHLFELKAGRTSHALLCVCGLPTAQQAVPQIREANTEPVTIALVR